MAAIAKTAMLARVKKALNEPTTRLDTEINRWIDRGARQTSALSRGDIVKETVTTRYNQIPYTLSNDFIEIHSVIADTSGAGLRRHTSLQTAQGLNGYDDDGVAKGYFYWGDELFLFPMVSKDSFVIGASNKVIILTYDSSPVTFTLTEDTYTADELCAEMVDQMDETFDAAVTFSTVTGKFTIANQDTPDLLGGYINTSSTLGATIGLTASQATSPVVSDTNIPVGTVDVYGYKVVADYGGAGVETLSDYLQNLCQDYVLSCAYTKLGRHGMAGRYMQKYMGLINQYRGDIYDPTKIANSLDQFRWADRTQTVGQ